MKASKFSEAMSELDDKYINEVICYKKKERKEKNWIKYASIAACLCIMLTLTTFYYQSMQNQVNTMGQGYTLSQAEQMNVEIVEKRDEGFTAIVVDEGSNNIFKEGAKLTIIFEDESEIILGDGISFEYNFYEPNAKDIEWSEGDIVSVEFTYYEEYLEGNGFYNRLVADRVEVLG